MNLQQHDTRSGFTFDVSDVELAIQKLPECSTQQSIERLMGAKIETCSGLLEPCVADVTSNPLVTAAAYAYAQHRPLTLGPDVIWLTILQGLSHHIEENWEELRSLVTTSQLQKRIIEVDTDGFPVGALESPWEEFIGEVASTAKGAVEEHFADLFDISFSTTGRRERAAMDVTLLAGLRPYLTLFDTSSICGIPAITIQGEADDWRKIRAAVEQLECYGLDWWTKYLRPICDEFINALTTTPNLDFWQRLFHYDPALCSDAERVTGWIGHLFPYLKSKTSTRRNAQFEDEAQPPDIIDFPSGLREVNVVAKDNSNLRLLGGLVGIAQNSESLALTPKVGWAVRRDNPLESLITRLSNLKQARIEYRPPNERYLSHITCPEFMAFYRPFECLAIDRGDDRSEMISFLRKECWNTERKNVFQIADLENDQFLGAVNIYGVGEVIFLDKPAGTIYFVGDESAFESDEPVNVIGTSFVEILERVLDCVQKNETITFKTIAQLDPTDEEARCAFLPQQDAAADD